MYSHEEVKSWISQRLLHEFLGFVPTIILRMHANSLGVIHTASWAELSWAWPDRAELAEWVTIHIAGRADLNWKQCSWHFWSVRMSNQVHVFSLMDNIWWRSLLFTTKRHFWVNNISSSHENFGEFHNLLDDLLNDEERFRRYFRMSSDTFKYILELIHISFKKQNTNIPRSISPEEWLMVTLR